VVTVKTATRKTSRKPAKSLSETKTTTTRTVFEPPEKQKQDDKEEEEGNDGLPE